MNKVLIILICLCLLFPVNVILAEELLIWQHETTGFSIEVENEFECIAQEWQAIPLQLDVTKISLNISFEIETTIVAGICTPDPEGYPKPLYTSWDAWCIHTLPGMEPDWVDFPLQNCDVIPGNYYYLLFKIIDPPFVDALVYGRYFDPYDKGDLWFYDGERWEEQLIDLPDIGFKIYGNRIEEPGVKTLDAEHIEDQSAELWGKILDDGGQECQIKFQIKEKDGNPWYHPDEWVGSYYTDNKFYEPIGGLNWDTEYLYKAGARNDRNPEGVWGDWISFTMDPDDRVPEHHAILFAPWFTPEVPYPDDDFWEPAFLLLERVLMDGGFQSKNIHTLYDYNASFENLVGTLTELNDDPWDTTLVVIGTHGAEGKFKVRGAKMESYEDLSKDGLDYLKSCGVCVMIEACDSESAIDYLKKDGRIIWTSSSEKAIKQFAMALDEFADYTEFGDKNGTVSVEEAYNHIENYEFGIHVHFRDDYPYEANNESELSITRQNWNDGRVDQLNGICCVTQGQYQYANQWSEGGKTLKNKNAQEFYPIDQYDKLIKVRTEVRTTDIPPNHNLLVSIRKEELENDDIESKQISPDDITYHTAYGGGYGEKYTTIKFDDYINIEPGMPTIPYFIVFSPTGTDEEICKYEIHCSLDETDYLPGNPYHCYNADGENDEWIEDTDRDIRFVTYGLNTTNMPPYTPKRPTSYTSHGNPEDYFYFYITTTDMDAEDKNDKVYYCMDWGDDTPEEWIGPYNSGDIIEVSHEWEKDKGGPNCVRVKAKDYLQDEPSGWSDVWPIYINQPPNKPDISGRKWIFKAGEYDYDFVSIDPDGDAIEEYNINWGDGSQETIEGPFASGEEITVSHTWSEPGRKTITATATDEYGLVSEEGSLGLSVYTFNHGVSQGTHITMAPGGLSPQPVESLRVGDLISSYNPTTQEMTIAEITAVLVFTENLPDRFIFNGNLEVTTEHTLYIDQMVWLDAFNAHVGQNMLENILHTPITIPAPIISKEPTSLGAPIYNLVIEPITGEASGYFANNILVGGYD
jgi:hypothetical protein